MEKTSCVMVQCEHRHDISKGNNLLIPLSVDTRISATCLKTRCIYPSAHFIVTNYQPLNALKIPLCHFHVKSSYCQGMRNYESTKAGVSSEAIIIESTKSESTRYVYVMTSSIYSVYGTWRAEVTILIICYYTLHLLQPPTPEPLVLFSSW